ncbi:hypothetical protein SAMN05880590_11067 [Rhizobium sp. RU35A]|uniref:hypothetical protein n=1 Tax=Rhizobium sp. RU35A TaxID=1907414 RepID=UPI00095567AE|nr:hypothetical protein [Rhizobium sp. RU35A]SIR00067.1 hypothetical protein SAMN05880590_11067 [Rhizobium sp. RU35A]
MLVMLAVLLLGARVAGQGVVESRMQRIELSVAERTAIQALSDLLDERLRSYQSVLLVDLGDASFIADTLQHGILLMDQSGMVSPWNLAAKSGDKLSYTEGLTRYLAEKGVAAIVSQPLSCGKQARAIPSGWAELILYAQQRNTQALCEIAKAAERVDIGHYTVLFLRKQ